MTAYMIFTREGPVRDEAEMAQYSAKNQAAAGKYVAEYGLKPLTFYGKQEVIEGDGPDGIVLLEFPDAEKARAWYDSPEYQDALQHRLKGATYRCAIVEPN
jgi:uncharacterized protein (DUF1330 family)